jgi:C4-dicarboxylate-specific signal transduction histidine kinase
LGAIVTDALALCAEHLKSRNIALETTGLERPIKISCRETQIVQVVVNLISNARDAVENLPEKWIRLALPATADGRQGPRTA